MSLAGDGGHVGPCTENIARRRHRHEAGAVREQVVVLTNRQLTGPQVHFRPPDDDAGARRGLNPRPNVRIVVEAGDDDLVARRPAGRQGPRQPVGQGRHVGPKDHPGPIAPDEVGDGMATFVGDLPGPLARRKCPADVGETGGVSTRDRLDDAGRKLGPSCTVKVGITVGQRRVLRPDLVDVERHRRAVARLSAPP